MLQRTRCVVSHHACLMSWVWACLRICRCRTCDSSGRTHELVLRSFADLFCRAPRPGACCDYLTSFLLGGLWGCTDRMQGCDALQKQSSLPGMHGLCMLAVWDQGVGLRREEGQGTRLACRVYHLSGDWVLG